MIAGLEVLLSPYALGATRKWPECVASPAFSALLFVLLLLSGCSNQTNVTSTGNEIVLTNGAAFEHTWNHSDRFTFISNTVPQ